MCTFISYQSYIYMCCQWREGRSSCRTPDGGLPSERTKAWGEMIHSFLQSFSPLTSSVSGESKHPIYTGLSPGHSKNGGFDPQYTKHARWLVVHTRFLSLHLFICKGTYTLCRHVFRAFSAEIRYFGEIY